MDDKDLRKRLHEVERNLEHVKNYDSVTDLPNRSFFEERVTTSLKKGQQHAVVLYLDIDRFKYFNDTFSHAEGDSILKSIASRLSMNLPHAFIARMGGDEFVIFLEDIDTEEKLQQELSSVLASFEDSYFIQGYEFHISSSIGISVYPSDGEDVKTLLKKAHNALHSAKEKGRGSINRYSSTFDQEVNKLFFLEHHLYKAFQEKAFSLYYQPRVEVNSGKVVAAEALIRWKGKDGATITPMEFIPVAEETGIIIPMGEWILETVCNQLIEWKEKGISIVPISVNLSSQTFLQPRFLEVLKHILETTKLDPYFLEVEITENILIKNTSEILDTLDELRRMGIKIALDDFGTGYCSLSYMKNIPMDIVKIDRSFIKNIPNEPVDTAIVSSVIHLAKILGKKVVAEGVETIEQMEFLYERNCDEIQGYLFSKPLSVEQFLDVLYNKQTKVLEADLLRENRRRYIRITFQDGIQASFMMKELNGGEQILTDVPIIIEDISLGGIKFFSNEQITASSERLYQVQLTLYNEQLNLFGQLMWQKHNPENNKYEYGLSLFLSENQRSTLQDIMNRVGN